LIHLRVVVSRPVREITKKVRSVVLSKCQLQRLGHLIVLHKLEKYGIKYLGEKITELYGTQNSLRSFFAADALSITQT
jgi:hypothetical protein